MEASEPVTDEILRSHPAHRAEVARDTAAMVARPEHRGVAPEVFLERFREFVDEAGLDTLQELWGDQPPTSLAGALWRMVQIRHYVLTHPETMATLFSRGSHVLPTIDPVIAGVPDPIDADGVVRVIDSVLSGALHGGLADALSRVAAFARVIAAGVLSVTESENHDGRSRSVLLGTLSWRLIADEVDRAAWLERHGRLQ